MIDYNQQGAEAYCNKNYDDAFRFWELAALEQNDPMAQTNLAMCYLNGLGTEKNLLEAIKWYKIAANNGFTDANFRCGYVYYIMEQYAEAFSWLTKAAEFNDANAEYYLGHMYLNGLACKSSEEEAYSWFMKSAEHGDVDSQKIIAKHYYFDLNDSETGLKWYIESAEQGDKESIDFLAYTYNINRIDVDNFIKWSTKAAENGNTDSQCNLGEYYLSVKQSEIGLQWLNLAAKNGNFRAILHLGREYYFGTYLKQNYTKAVSIFQSLVNCGNKFIEGDAFEMLAGCYYNGFGVSVDYNNAYKCIIQAKNKRGWFSDISNLLLGLCYYWGNGVERNYEAAFGYLNKSAEQGNCSAKELIAESYFYGTHVNKDYLRAITIFKSLLNCSDDIVKGHSLSMLGWCYYFGCGISKDYKTAYQYLIKAESTLCDQLDSNGAFVLGLCYYHGHGTEQDYKRAFHYFREYSKNLSHNLCIYGLGRCYYLGHGIQQDKDKGRKLLIIASENGVMQASELLKNKYCIDGDFQTSSSIIGKMAGSVIKELVLSIIGGNNED